ncbi:MAG: beta-propeller domain-containing protein [Acidimicrobiia bacterium]|jgi:hypothetical protein
MQRTNRLLGLAVTLAVLAGACTASPVTEENLPSGTTPDPQIVRTAEALVRFDACDEFLDYVISNAVDLVGPYGLEGLEGYPLPFRAGDMMIEEMAATATTEAASASFSQTNVQVAGVDEPDIIKTDGSRVVLVSEGQLIVVDVTGDEPIETGRLTLGNQAIQTMFLEGDKALLFGTTIDYLPFLAETDAEFAPQYYSETIEILEVDLGDEPEVERTMSIDGHFVSGRMVDGAVRLVTTSGPVGFEWSYPSGTGLRAERKAIEENKEIIRNSTEENWIPYYIVTDGDDDVIDEGTLFDCERGAHPDEFSGLNMLSVTTIDLSKGLDLVDATGVLANGDTVYASTENLYVATQNWQTWAFVSGVEEDQPDGPTTEIHKFDISDPRVTDYVASGSVAGYLLSQFAMDEHEGVLRVASTTTPWGWGSGPDSESRVTILGEVGGNLVEVGKIVGLGETEQIYSVRFLGDVGYVVTFRQTDPLYTIDLSNPRAPRLAGELKIPGYSAYLHPLGDGLLMGVGQDATETGRGLGSQVSIFDVSDPSDPERVDTFTLSKGSNSEVEYDHHAFLYWDGLVVIPVQQYWWEEDKEDFFTGAIALRVSADGELTDLGTVTHPGGDEWDWGAQIRRSVVVGDSVYTVSLKGIMKSSLDDLSEEAWLGF